RAFEHMRDVQDPRYPLTVYYGYQQGDNKGNGGAWEALLESLISAGFRITASWPLRTERPEGVKKGTKSLASSVLLVCRAAEHRAGRPVATLTDLRGELRADLPGAIRLFQQANVAPLDLAQAAVGVGMAAYTRYGRVLASDGSPMGVRAALALINEVFDETLTDTGDGRDAERRAAQAPRH
ncbi:MAG: hypothetical protein OXH20_05345, partial [bacterium]|nr:hypothetical protein [bacterium]